MEPPEEVRSSITEDLTTVGSANDSEERVSVSESVSTTTKIGTTAETFSGISDASASAVPIASCSSSSGGETKPPQKKTNKKKTSKKSTEEGKSLLKVKLKFLSTDLVTSVVRKLSNKNGSSLKSIRRKLIRTGNSTSDSMITSALRRAVMSGQLEIRGERYFPPNAFVTHPDSKSRGGSNTSCTTPAQHSTTAEAYCDANDDEDSDENYNDGNNEEDDMNSNGNDEKGGFSNGNYTRRTAIKNLQAEHDDDDKAVQEKNNVGDNGSDEKKDDFDKDNNEVDDARMAIGNVATEHDYAAQRNNVSHGDNTNDNYDNNLNNNNNNNNGGKTRTTLRNEEVQNDLGYATMKDKHNDRSDDIVNSNHANKQDDDDDDKNDLRMAMAKEKAENEGQYAGKDVNGDDSKNSIDEDNVDDDDTAMAMTRNDGASVQDGTSSA